MVWEAIFFLLILKIPVVYLGSVVWWALRDAPAPEQGLEGSVVPVPPETDPRPGTRLLRRRRPQAPSSRGGPVRSYRRRAALARARVRR